MAERVRFLQIDEKEERHEHERHEHERHQKGLSFREKLSLLADEHERIVEQLQQVIDAYDGGMVEIPQRSHARSFSIKSSGSSHASSIVRMLSDNLAPKKVTLPPSALRFSADTSPAPEKHGDDPCPPQAAPPAFADTDASRRSSKSTNASKTIVESAVDLPGSLAVADEQSWDKAKSQNSSDAASASREQKERRKSVCSRPSFRASISHKSIKTSTSHAPHIMEWVEEYKATLKLRSQWQQSRLSTRQDNMVHTRTNIDYEDFMVPQSEASAQLGTAAWFVIPPSSPGRMCWDLVGAFLLAFDMIFIPIGAFDPGRTTFLQCMDWTTLIFWTLDMLFSFFVGYVRHGVTILEPKQVACHYVRTWFAIDIFVVGCDWVFTCALEGSGGDAVKALKVLRVVRTLRLLRLMKLKRMLNQIQDRIDSEGTHVVANIIKISMMMVLANHFVACTWYLIGRAGKSEHGPSWITIYGMEAKTWPYRYFTALHWALTQFTPGSMDVQPQNTGERIFAVSMLVLGMIIFSSFISSITTAMTSLRELQSDNANQCWLLRRYLRQRNVPEQLRIRIQKYAEFAILDQKKFVPEGRVKLLAVLSDQLKEELHCAMIYPHFMTHAFFQHLHDLSPKVIDHLATNAMTLKPLAVGDQSFSTGEVANSMAFLSHGLLYYRNKELVALNTSDVTQKESYVILKAKETISNADVCSPDGSPQHRHQSKPNFLKRAASRMSTRSMGSIDHEENMFVVPKGVLAVLPGSWASEQVLWLRQWHHCGNLTARKESAVILVSGDRFTKIVSANSKVTFLAQMYAANFFDWLSSLPTLTDIFVAEEARQNVAVMLGLDADFSSVNPMSFSPRLFSSFGGSSRSLGVADSIRTKLRSSPASLHHQG